MPGRSKDPAVKLAKRAAMVALRVRARARAEPGAVTNEQMATAREIMRELAAGSNVRAACLRRDIPDYCYWDWIARAPVLLPEHELALRNRSLAYGEQPVALADADPMTYTDQHGVRRIDPGYVQLQKLRINARQWDAERLRSESYAPPSTAADRGPVAVTVTVERFIEAPSDEQREHAERVQQAQRERA
jgi:hypothetical protein